MPSPRGRDRALGQVAIGKKSNEVRALPTLLEMLELEGAVAAADALHTQRDTAELIIGKAGTAS